MVGGIKVGVPFVLLEWDLKHATFSTTALPLKDIVTFQFYNVAFWSSFIKEKYLVTNFFLKMSTEK